MTAPLPDALRALLPLERPALALPPRVATGARRPTVAALFPDGVVDEEAALGCLAGVLLLRDDHEHGHAVCQDLDTADGAYWHGIAHRREPDAGNAKYWMRRVGRHPIHDPLARDILAVGASHGASAGGLLPADAALATAAGGWDACRFVDACCAPRMTARQRAALESWQWHEALLLLAHGAARALGRGA